MPEAPVKVVEYVDILCPYCAKSNQPGDIIPRMTREYIDTGKVYFEVRVVAKVSPDSARAGIGAYCAAEQDKFWPYIDKAYGDTWSQYYSQNKRTDDVAFFQKNTIHNFAKSVPGLDEFVWQECMEGNQYGDILQKNAADMTRLEAYGTPTIVIDGKSYTGTPPYAAFQAVINAALKKRASESA